MAPAGWTAANLRHALGFFRQGRNPAAAVYDSIGPDFFLALAPGWLNLGLWEGQGDEDEAPVAVRRLVESLAAWLPVGGTILDVGNGLGAQDLAIARVARPARLVALNITESQLHAGRTHLEEAGACAVVGDATSIPLAEGTIDGLISVETAFHFSSQRWPLWPPRDGSSRSPSFTRFEASIWAAGRRCIKQLVTPQLVIWSKFPTEKNLNERPSASSLGASPSATCWPRPSSSSNHPYPCWPWLPLEKERR